MKRVNSRKEKGYTLLEYVAGAAVIGGILIGALQVFGNGLNSALSNLGTWATAQTQNLPNRQ